MIPQKYIVGDANKASMQGLLIKEGTEPQVYVDTIAWLEDIEKSLGKLRENLAAAGGVIFKKPVDGVILSKDNIRAEIAFYENDKKLSEVLKEIKDPEKQKLKLYEFTEFIIFNLLASRGPDNKPLMDPDRQKQIVDNAMKKLSEEKIKKEEEKKAAEEKEKKEKEKTDKEILGTPSEHLSEMGRKRKKQLEEKKAKKKK